MRSASKKFPLERVVSAEATTSMHSRASTNAFGIGNTTVKIYGMLTEKMSSKCCQKVVDCISMRAGRISVDMRLMDTTVVLTFHNMTEMILS